MRNPVTLQTMAQSLRVKVCPDCPRRPRGSEGWNIDRPRPCEASCPLFVRLPLLARVAANVDPLVGSRERVLRGLMRRLAQTPKGEPAAGAADGEPAAGSVFRRLGRRVVRVIDDLTPG